jgi:hypothetical protein
VTCYAEAEPLPVPLGRRGNSDGFREGRFNSADTDRRLFGQVVFPNSQDVPAVFSEGACDKPIPCHVGRQFLFPEWPVVHWQVGMPWASMPEAAVNENNDALPAKGEVRFSKMLLSTTPAGDVMGPEKFCKGKLGVLVAMSANTGHDL